MREENPIRAISHIFFIISKAQLVDIPALVQRQRKHMGFGVRRVGLHSWLHQDRSALVDNEGCIYFRKYEMRLFLAILKKEKLMRLSLKQKILLLHSGLSLSLVILCG